MLPHSSSTVGGESCKMWIQCLRPQAKGWKGMVDNCFRCMYSRREQVWQLGHCLDHERTGYSGRCLVILDDLHANHLVRVQVQTLHLKKSAWGMPLVEFGAQTWAQDSSRKRGGTEIFNDLIPFNSSPLIWVIANVIFRFACHHCFRSLNQSLPRSNHRVCADWKFLSKFKLAQNTSTHQQLSSTSEVNCSNVYIWSSWQSRKRPCSLQSPSCPFRRQPADWRSRRSQIFEAGKNMNTLMTQRHTMSKRLLFKFWTACTHCQDLQGIYGGL